MGSRTTRKIVPLGQQVLDGKSLKFFSTRRTGGGTNEGASSSLSYVTSNLALFLDAGDSSSYPGSGTTWTDLSGNGNNGTLVNGPTYSSADGGSIVFDGSNDYVTLPSNSINSNADLTLNFWNKTPSSLSSIRTLLGTSPSGSSHLQIRYYGTSVQIVNSNVVNVGTFTGFTASTSTIYLITITLTKSTNTYSLYVNGSFFSSFTSSQSYSTGLPALGINNNTEFFNSNMYAFSYYNRVLSASEILQNFNAQNRFGI